MFSLLAQIRSTWLTHAIEYRGSRPEDQRGTPYASFPMYSNMHQPSSSGPPSGSMMGSWGNSPPQQPAYHTYQPTTTVESFAGAQWPASYPPSDFNQSTYVSSNQSTTYYSPLGPAQPVEDGQRGPYKCRWCERVFAHESSKCRHEKEHFNSFPCPEPGCDVVSSRKDSLKRHQRLMHGQASSSRGNGGNVSGGQ